MMRRLAPLSFKSVKPNCTEFQILMNPLLCPSLRTAITLFLLVVFGLPTHSAEPMNAFEERLKPAFAKHCLECHGSGDEIMGDVNLAAMSDVSDLLAKPELIQDLIRVVDLGEMPPDE